MNHSRKCRDRFEEIFSKEGDPRLLRQVERKGYESNAELAKRHKLPKLCKSYISAGKCDNEKLPGLNACKNGVHVTKAQHKKAKEATKTKFKAARGKRNAALAAAEAKK